MKRSRFTWALSFVTLAACGGTPRSPAPAAAKPLISKESSKAGKLTTDPDLNRKPPAKLLAIEWSKVALTSEADALALWKQIAPTGEDWESKLAEIPGDTPVAAQLALALLHGGNFTCVPPQATNPNGCTRAPIDVPLPDATSTLDDPCLRRMIALWAIDTLDESDVPAARDALFAIAAIPPPESELASLAIDAFPATDQDTRLAIRAVAYAAGHTELVNSKLGEFDVAHLTTAVQKHHIAGALDVLSAEANRDVYLAAVTDDKLPTAPRTSAINDLVATVETPRLPKDLRSALVTATKGKDCGVAAAAARALVSHGEKTFGPARPQARTEAAMMRALCVLASYETAAAPDEASYLLGYVPRTGLDVITVEYDPYNNTDEDGDGDPHTVRTRTHLGRDEVVLPEGEDMVRAFASCKGTVCRSDDHEFRFTLAPGAGALQLTRIEVIERPPCAVITD